MNRVRVKIHQGRVVRKIVIRGVNAKVRVGDGGTRHVQGVNNLLKIRGGTVGGNVISEYDEGLDEGKKSKTHCLFNQKETNKSHDHD